MATMEVRVDHAPGSVAILTLNRPPVNALNSASLEVIGGALAALEPDPDVRAVVLTGGGTAFSAGMDLKEVQAFTVDDQTATVKALSRLLTRLYGFPKPVIAAVNGHAIAGGLLLLLATDYRVASTGAAIGMAEVRVGVRFPLAALSIVRGELSPPMQRRLLLSGKTITADAAQQSDIVDEVVDVAGLMDRAVAAAADLATIPPKTFAAVKSQLRSETLSYMEDVTVRDADPMLQGWFTDETKAAAQAIIQSRAK